MVGLMSTIAAIILAAGRSTRFGPDSPPGGKLVASLRGKPLVRHVAEAALASIARPILVVTGHAAANVEAALAEMSLTFVANPGHRTGLSSSLQVGVAALPETVAAAVILLGDMPYVSAALVDRLIHAFREPARTPLAVTPVRAGRRGNPVVIGRGLFGALAQLEGDRGARALIDAAGNDVLECPVDDDAIEIDIDTQDALRRLEAG